MRNATTNIPYSCSKAKAVIMHYLCRWGNPGCDTGWVFVKVHCLVLTFWPLLSVCLDRYFLLNPTIGLFFKVLHTLALSSILSDRTDYICGEAASSPFREAIHTDGFFILHSRCSNYIDPSYSGWMNWGRSWPSQSLHAALTHIFIELRSRTLNG